MQKTQLLSLSARVTRSLAATRHGASRLLGAAVVMGLTIAPASGNEFFTNFEGPDLIGDFTLGDAPLTVSFTGGDVFRLGVLRLYHSGLKSWMVDAGGAGTIVFETPPRHVDLFFRDQDSGVQSVLTVLDEADDVLATFDGASSRWTEVALTTPVGSPRIKTITLQNNGATGFAVIDDFGFCVEPGSGSRLEDPIPQPIRKSRFRSVKLETVATGLTAPNWGTVAPGHPGRLFVTDQVGILWAIDLATGDKTVFLDVSARLVALGVGGPGTFDERGFLGAAFHPDYTNNGLLFTYTSEPVGPPADFSTMPAGTVANHQSVINEWRVPNPSDPHSVVDPTSSRELLRIDEPQFNHDGGALVFGPDGMLHVSLGDGGRFDDQGTGHGAAGNGQDPTNVLGTILRLDPDGSNSDNGSYGVPGDNPFVGVAGFAPEIYAYGFRNPFRFSFDSDNGELYVADVGQNDIEEVDIVVAGGNYGWNFKEASFFFDPNGNDPGFVTDVDPGVPPGLIDPIAEYDHDEGLAVIGGFVYRGSRIRFLKGRYVFGDFARTFSNDGRLFYLARRGRIVELRIAKQASLGLSLLGFGQDASGELYVLGSATGVPSGETGVVLKIVPKKTFSRDSRRRSSDRRVR